MSLPDVWRHLTQYTAGLYGVTISGSILLLGSLLVLNTSMDLNSHPLAFAVSIGIMTLGYLVGVIAVWFSLSMSENHHVLIAILVAGVLVRLTVLFVAPFLSHDAYRYIWDAHLIRHGISPYATTPDDPLLISLRDNSIWPDLNWRTAPTIYPPGAQFFFLLITAIAPLNISALKIAMFACDAGVAALLLILLHQHRRNLRWVLVYWWSPIPIIEFSGNAHVDVVALLWVLGALVLWRSAEEQRGSQWYRLSPWNDILVGICIGMATLTKIYPLLFVGLFWRRRTLALPVATVGTLVIGYALLAPIGLGNGGFLGTYFSQRFVDQGLAVRILSSLLVGFPGAQKVLILCELAGVGLLTVAITLWRWKRPGQLSPEQGLLLITGVWIIFSPHLFPWYVGIILPMLPVIIPWRAPLAAFWVFTLLMPLTYAIFAPGQPAYLFVAFFIVPLLLAMWPSLQRLTNANEHPFLLLRRKVF